MKYFLGNSSGRNAALLSILLIVLWIAGGAARADVLGQVVVRCTAWALLVVLIMLGAKNNLPEKPILWLFLAGLVLVLLQLVPLPPVVWQALPGRNILMPADAGTLQPWRPWSMVPGATWNAAFSLVIPFTALLLIAGLGGRERNWVPALLLGLIAASALIGLMQFSGVGFSNPFVNDTPGEVSGNFANRNHFALFMAIGCLLAPAWAFLGGGRPHWRGTVAVGLVLLFALTILASGSRAGIFVGVLGLGIGLATVYRPLRRVMRNYPRWVFPVLIGAVLMLIVTLVGISVVADRAASINRIMAIDSSEDMRGRALPALLEMLRVYFPSGSGFGGFDPVFRIHEPFHLLKSTYFNHAHNDLLEIVLDGGLPGLILLSVALGWWLVMSVRVWRRVEDTMLPRLGSATILLVVVASLVDYPARTPIIMAVVAIAATWLAQSGHNARAPLALPKEGQ